MKGWLDNMEDGGKFDGLTTSGFNYNGAWGGPAQYGGSMPGSVGFTYARNGAPSNGKHAKKTLPSAQNGTLKDLLREVKSNPLQKSVEKEKRSEALRRYVDTDAYKYRNVTSQHQRQQPMLSQDNRTMQEINKSAEAMRNVHEGNLYGERPLLYLSNPTKMLGDVGVPGFKGTEEDRQRIMLNRYNPTLTDAEKIKRQVGMGLEEVPSAALNVALSSMAVGEGGLAPSMSRVLKEAYNPIPLPFSMGMKDTSAFWRNLKNEDDVAGLVESQGIFRGKYPTNTRLLDYENLNTEVPKYNPFSNQMMNMNRTNDIPLSREMEPYLSRYTPPISREEEVFQNSMGTDYISRKFDERTVHLDRDGNVISPPQQQYGGIIDDDMGQWAHPGAVTRINSNNITMRGVPYDVLGISDVGDKKLMKPGKNYKFKGKKVTELPVGKNGSELVKLDQLTNFTNYNTKQPGGWLDNL